MRVKISAAPIWFPDDDRREILAAIDEVLRSGQLTLGRHGQAFEEEFAKFVGVRHAIAVNSGTSSLEIIFRAL
ncbi:MAG: DegT/DnrJ/EryC1/StrS aminotransferase family protein, partial [Candidatus Rokubacteria bacterium]|nr:DegT/DnrJ/EryC1/StrS aminotransferase family protein [Candidatus Rokubacteria bacterium]